MVTDNVKLSVSADQYIGLSITRHLVPLASLISSSSFSFLDDVIPILPFVLSPFPYHSPSSCLPLFSLSPVERSCNVLHLLTSPLHHYPFSREQEAPGKAARHSSLPYSRQEPLRRAGEKYKGDLVWMSLWSLGGWGGGARYPGLRGSGGAISPERRARVMWRVMECTHTLSHMHTQPSHKAEDYKCHEKILLQVQGDLVTQPPAHHQYELCPRLGPIAFAE